MKKRNLLFFTCSAVLLLYGGMTAQAYSVVSLPDFGDFAEDYILDSDTKTGEYANTYYYEVSSDISVDLLKQYIDLLVSDYDLSLTDYRVYEPDDTYSYYTQYGWFAYIGSESPDPFSVTIKRDSYEIDPAHVVIEYHSDETSVDNIWLSVSSDMYMIPCEERPTGLSVSEDNSSNGESSGGSTSANGFSGNYSYDYSNDDSDNSRKIKCTKCFGSGEIDCTACGGDGGKYVYDNSTPNYSGSLSGPISGKTWENCYKCHGSGEQTCSRCGGSGWQ